MNVPDVLVETSPSPHWCHRPEDQKANAVSRLSLVVARMWIKYLSPALGPLVGAARRVNNHMAPAAGEPN